MIILLGDLPPLYLKQESTKGNRKERAIVLSINSEPIAIKAISPQKRGLRRD
jgi:hypothetical protein